MMNYVNTRNKALNKQSLHIRIMKARSAKAVKLLVLENHGASHASISKRPKCGVLRATLTSCVGIGIVTFLNYMR